MANLAEDQSLRYLSNFIHGQLLKQSRKMVAHGAFRKIKNHDSAHVLQCPLCSIPMVQYMIRGYHMAKNFYSFTQTVL